MTRDGISKKQRQDDQRRKRAQRATGLAKGAKNPPLGIAEAAKQSRPSVGRTKAMPTQLPPAHHYPVTRVAIGKRQTPGGG